MLAVSLECLDLPSKEQTGHFSSYHSLCMCKCVHDVCVCAQPTDQVITVSLICICMCMYVCEVCAALSLELFIYKVCYWVNMIVFTSHL